MKVIKVYIGDGVYAERLEDGAFKLTTENGIRTTNEIYLEPDVLKVLVEFAEEQK